MENMYGVHSELRMIQRTLTSEIGSEGRRLKICLLATFLFGLLAHGYGFLNLTINHDSLNEFYWAVSRDWKIALGRFMEPALRYLMGEIIVLPWVTGLAGLLFCGLSVHLLSKMFALDAVWENLLVAGVCVTNVAVSSIVASFIHDFAGDMLALLLCLTAAYSWTKLADGFSWKHFLLGIVCLAVSFGFYQAYLAVTATAVCIYGIISLLKGASAKRVVPHLLWAIAMALAAVTLYLCSVTLVLRILGTHLSGGSGNNMTKLSHNITWMDVMLKNALMVLKGDFFLPNKTTVQGVFGVPTRTIVLFNKIFLVLSLVTVLGAFLKKKMKWQEIGLTLVLIALLPFCMICIIVISTTDHQLMRYAFYLYYLLTLALFRYARQNLFPKIEKWGSLALSIMIGFMIFSNIQIANIAYERKDLERQATLSTMTRALSQLESYDGYVYGESKVALVGEHGRQYIGLETYFVDQLVGLRPGTQITYRNQYGDTLKAYFDIVLQYPINLCTIEEEAQIRKTEQFQNMPIFPRHGSIETINDIVVIRMDY